MDDWIELINNKVFTNVLAVHIKNNKVMVRVRDEVNLFSFNSNEEAIFKAEKIAESFNTLTEESIFNNFLKLFDVEEQT